MINVRVDRTLNARRSCARLEKSLNSKAWMFGKGSPDRVNDTRDYKVAVPANCTRPTHCVELVNCFSSLGNGVLLQHALQAGTFLWRTGSSVLCMFRMQPPIRDTRGLGLGASQLSRLVRHKAQCGHHGPSKSDCMISGMFRQLSHDRLRERLRGFLRCLAAPQETSYDRDRNISAIVSIVCVILALLQTKVSLQ